MLKPISCRFFVLVLSLFVVYIKGLQIPLDSKLFASNHNYWVSSNGNFALGFFNNSNDPNKYSVGIRFSSASIPSDKQARIWVAGAGISVGSDSYLHLTETGDLILFDSLTAATVWSSNTSNSSVSSASLLDDGNLVLLGQNHNVIWQSFRTPTDTLLPGQNLTVFETLRAASRNSVSSHYTLSMDASGMLKLSWETNVTYWKAEVAPTFPTLAAVVTREGSFQLVDQMSRPVWSMFAVDHNDSSVVFRFLRLDADGNLRMYSWDDSSKLWRKVWQAVANQCNVFATCGLSGVCTLSQVGTATCKCPFGSSSLAANSSCLAPYYQHCSSGTTMVAFKHTFLYGIYPPQDSIIQSSARQCRDLCLQDPNCMAATATNDGEAQCRIKKTRFITGHGNPSLPYTSYVKICLDPLAAFPLNASASSPSTAPLNKEIKRFYIPSIIGPISGALLAFVAIQVGILFFLWKRKNEVKSTGATYCPCPSSIGLVPLSYSELINITGNFKDQLGTNLYKGVLLSNKVVVVWELKYAMQSGEIIGEKLFRSWISALGGIHHKNLVKLEGYCCCSDRRFLLYEFHKNGSVDKWITEAKLSRRLTWRRRVKICVGVAKVISYLHSGCREFVAHGNLKWENVLLDEELEAKVTKFGLKRMSGKASESEQGAEADVASFGEMILRMVSGRHAGTNICCWAHNEWAEGRGVELVDSRIRDKFDVDEVERMLRIAFWCVQSDARLRPSMGEVVKVLEGTLSADPPPPP
ncbi:G-type lectin S-receptor-like serine/threonine-protein kinase SD3-1 [Ananas comosus]|uniref:Receptor-like serine/threonine-protein kinase n=1 Tax=Ananas comosus TaxID=4615 RepID=A0A6P5FAZ5_ANACO|nr:G-type lectin S-receptor-like serine/threonine-protein kinase SD3-1 [Ananas comosus]